MLDDLVLHLAKKVDSTVEPSSIVKLSGGFSSHAYKVNGSDSPFVLLVEKEGAVSKVNYGHAYVVLKLLQKHGLKHSPTALWINQDHHALAISFFDGISSDKFDFKKAHVDAKQLSIDVIDSLLDTNVVTREEYDQLAQELNVKPLPLQTAEDAAREYGTEWFSLVKQFCPDQSIVKWLEPRIELMQSLAKDIGDHKPMFGLCDPSNPNILINGNGQFILIDWDSARFHTSGPEFYVGYTTELTDFMRPYREVLIDHVATRLNIPVDKFAKEVYEFRRYSGIGDVNWAAMMMAKVNAGEIKGDIDHFRKIANTRIELYEKSFED